jgi:hypothetical protein
MTQAFQKTDAVLEERLRQARLSFNLSLASAAVCAVVGSISMVMNLVGKLPESAYLTMGAMPLSAACLQSAKEANDRLDRLIEELHEAENSGQ